MKVQINLTLLLSITLVLLQSAFVPVVVPQQRKTTQARVPVLQNGQGVNHVGIAVRDLDGATRTYRDLLGFTIRPGGKLTGGYQHAHVFFKDRTFLELITFYDREEASDIAAFLDQHEGAWFLGLEVSSADQTAALLRSRGFDIDGPRGGTIIREGYNDIPPELWRLVEFRKAVVPDNAIEVNSLTAARRVLESSTKRKYQSYAGLYGRSILIRAEVAQGAWLEMFQAFPP